VEQARAAAEELAGALAPCPAHRHPTLTAVVLGGTRILSSAQSYLADQRVEQLSELSNNTRRSPGA